MNACIDITLVLSLLAINCRSLELIVEQIVVFPLSSDNSAYCQLSALLVTGADMPRTLH